MAKNCIYCKIEVDQNSVVDVCYRCGHAVWGEKMFKAIIENMEGARKSRLLYIPNYLEENHLRGFAIKNDSTVFASETIDADHIREIRRLQYDNDAYPPTDMVLVSEKDGL